MLCMHIQDIPRITSLCLHTAFVPLANDLVPRRPAYCNSILIITIKWNLYKLQMVPNSVVRAMTKTSKCQHIDFLFHSVSKAFISKSALMTRNYCHIWCAPHRNSVGTVPVRSTGTVPTLFGRRFKAFGIRCPIEIAPSIPSTKMLQEMPRTWWKWRP